MTSDNLKRVLFGLILFALFSSLMLKVAIDFGIDNGKNISEIGSGVLTLGVFEQSIQGVNESAEGFRSRFEGGDVDDIDDPSGLFSVVTDMVSLITTPFSLLSQVLTNLFDLPEIFINVVLGLLSLMLILAIWSLLRKGD